MRRHGDEENFAEAQEKGYLVAQKTAVSPSIRLAEWYGRLTLLRFAPSSTAAS
jgi:hypothetical protein